MQGHQNWVAWVVLVLILRITIGYILFKSQNKETKPDSSEGNPKQDFTHSTDGIPCTWPYETTLKVTIADLSRKWG